MTSSPEDKQAADAAAQRHRRSGQKAADKQVSDAELTDDLVTTQHSISTDDGELAYTVATGRMVLRLEGTSEDKFDGQRARAEVFVTAYTADVDDPGSRPVTFAFNGGPGSSSVWLHLGLLGPRRVMMGDVGDLLPPPYALADNPQTLLRHSDLVFIDPVSTGYPGRSRGRSRRSSTGTAATSSRSAR